jgi:hypothetical protein
VPDRRVPRLRSARVYPLNAPVRVAVLLEGAVS